MTIGWESIEVGSAVIGLQCSIEPRVMKLTNCYLSPTDLSGDSAKIRVHHPAKKFERNRTVHFKDDNNEKVYQNFAEKFI